MSLQPKMSQIEEDNPFQVLFPEGVVTMCSELHSNYEFLYPEERALIGHAISKRQSEFATGRLLCRNALAQFGVEDFPILMDRNRSPIWPEGYTGTITHTSSNCAVAVAKTLPGQSLGMDLEDCHRLKPRIWPNSFVEDEIAWLFLIDERDDGDSTRWATLLFAAKEAFYKAQYPLTHAWVGFKDVSVKVDPDNGTFELTLLRDIPLLWRKYMKFQGRFFFYENQVAAGLWIDLKELK